MGLMDSALNIGRSALLGYQNALQVIGNNISNAGSPNYTRQTPGLTPLNGPGVAEGMRPGAGVALTSLKRNLDEALENRVRAAIGESQEAQTRQQALGLVEGLFDPTTGLQLDARLADFFNSVNDVQNTPSDPAIRELVVASGVTLADSLQQMRTRLGELSDQFNEDIESLVGQANDLASRIAELNTEIVSTESTGAPASALRDQRDALLRDLSEIVDVRVRMQADQTVNVYIGNEALVQGGASRGFDISVKLDGQRRRDTLVFADNNQQVAVGTGKLGGLISARDEQTFARIDDIDRLASAVIYEVNRIHADGQGNAGYTELTSTNAVDDPTAALNASAAGLPFMPQNGSFYVAVTDAASGTTTSYQVRVDLDGIDEDTTLESLVADINTNVEGLNAEITIDNRLRLTGDNGKSFKFGYDGAGQREDTSNLLASLGVNTFFEGSSAADIDVNENLRRNADLLATSSSNLAGDGTNAARLTLVADTASSLLSGVTISDFQTSITGSVAVASAGARGDVAATESVLASLQAQKENISGVSLDEEAIELVKFERAFQGAARFVSVVDRLSAELISLVS